MMLTKIRAAIEEYKMLPTGGRVLVALSGGADSTALVLSLKELGYRVRAMHINHNLRGGDSLRDQSFCEELCRRYEIPFRAESVDVKGYCAEKKVSLETGARELRYKALFEEAGGEPVATAHTLSDCLETAIFNLTRGCGIKGICGIPPVRGKIIRPLIDCTRDEIESFLRERGVGWVTDSTNLVDGCSRNIIRLNVIPELLRINPGLLSSFSGTVKALREAEGYISESSRRLFDESRAEGEYDFSEACDDASLSGALALLLKEAGVEPSYLRICDLKRIISEGGAINPKKGVYLRAERGKIRIERPREAFEPVKTSLRGETRAMGKIIGVTKISHFDISRFNKSALRYFFDEAKMAGEYTVRPYSGNERIKLAGREHSFVVKKLLAEVPPGERKGRIVIDDGFGAVFVEGAGVAERAACSESTRSAIKIYIKDI